MEIRVHFEMAEAIHAVRFAKTMLGHSNNDVKRLEMYKDIDKRKKGEKLYNIALHNQKRYAQEYNESLMRLGEMIADCELTSEELLVFMEDVIAHPHRHSG